MDRTSAHSLCLVGCSRVAISLRRPDLGERPTLPDFSVIAKDIAVGIVPHAPKNGRPEGVLEAIIEVKLSRCRCWHCGRR